MKVLPKVSFLIVAYNQEDYIQETIDSALAQDYANMQLVLSDDCSADGTYEIMLRNQREHGAQREIIVNRTRKNGLGVLQHIYSALSLCDGDLLVGNGGDDIAMPNRVSRLVAAWRDSGAVGIYSAWNRVDEHGRFLAREGIAEQYRGELGTYFRKDVGVTMGCTAAYGMDFLRSVSIPETPIWSEDYYLSAIAALRHQKIIFLDEVLVAYRQNPRAQRNFAPKKIDHANYELKDSKHFRDLHLLLLEIRKAFDLEKKTSGEIDYAALNNDLAWFDYRSRWMSTTLAERLSRTITLREPRKLRWALPRLAGFGLFLKAKNLTSMLR